jgi:hypothetical protein
VKSLCGSCNCQFVKKYIIASRWAGWHLEATSNEIKCYSTTTTFLWQVYVLEISLFTWKSCPKKKY